MSNGAPGRVGHLKRWHASEISDLLPPKVSTKGEKRARETEAKHGITKEALPFSILDDEFLLTISTGLTRNNVAEKMEARAADKYKHEYRFTDGCSTVPVCWFTSGSYTSPFLSMYAVRYQVQMKYSAPNNLYHF